MEQPSCTATVVTRKGYSARKRARREARAESRTTALIAEYRGLLLNYGKVIARIAAIDVEHAESICEYRGIGIPTVVYDRRSNLVRAAWRKLARASIVRAKLEAAGCTFVFPQRETRTRTRTLLIQAPTFDCHFLRLPCCDSNA